MIGMIFKYRKNNYRILSYPVLGADGEFYIFSLRLSDNAPEMVRTDSIEFIENEQNNSCGIGFGKPNLDFLTIR